jgi:uncharacterized protein (TIRG00374 family)
MALGSGEGEQEADRLDTRPRGPIVDPTDREQSHRVGIELGAPDRPSPDGAQPDHAQTPTDATSTEAGRAEQHIEEMPRVLITRRQALAFAAFAITAIAFLYFVLPQLGVVQHTLDQLNGGNVWWIGVAAALELLAILSYVAIFHGIHVPPGSQLSFRESYLITMAGLAATRLFAAGGAGGVAVTAWALRRFGLERRDVARRMIAFVVLLYGVYVLAMTVVGIALYLGVLPGAHPFAITIGPAIVGGIALLVLLSIAFVPDDLEGRLRPAAADEGRATRAARRLATVPASAAAGIRFAWEKLRRPDLAMLGVVSWWAFNVAILYASFRAFGPAPPVGVLIQAYFVGLLANLLPLPGGIGGVDGGMIGALAAFGVSVGLAVPAVLTYRLFAFWLPTIPGAIAYFQLRRRVNRWDASGENDARIRARLGEGSVAA